MENDWPAIAPGDFVEVTGVFRPNPFTDALATTSRVLDIIELVSQLDAATPTQGRKSQGSSKTQQRQQASELSQMRKFFDGLAQDAEGQHVLVFLIETPLAAHTVVVFVFPEYLRDKTFTELLQGEFRVLGKAVRKIDWDSDERIELLRGSALGSLNEEMLTPLIGALQEMASAGMRLPEIVTEVNPPALQLIPIAIYA